MNEKPLLHQSHWELLRELSVLAICLIVCGGTASNKAFWKLGYDIMCRSNPFACFLVSKLPSVSAFAPAKIALSLMSFPRANSLSVPWIRNNSSNSRVVVLRTIAFWCVVPLDVKTTTTLAGWSFSVITFRALFASSRRNLFVSAVRWRRGPTTSSSS